MAVFEPEPVSGCVSTKLKSRLYVWGGKKMESGDSSHLRYLYILDTRSEEWSRSPIDGEHPAGFNNCTSAVQDSGVLYIYGGQDKDDKFMGSLHCLDLDHLNWKELSSHTLDGPKKKIYCGMIICGDKIILFGGLLEDESCTNELHLFDLLAETWSCPVTTGDIPPPCRSFSLVQTNVITAMLFGGNNYNMEASNQLYKLHLKNLHWSKVPRKDGDAWPEERYYHDGCCIAPNTDHTQLLISGGRKRKIGKYYDDIWLLDIRSMTWTKATEENYGEDPLPAPPVGANPERYAFSMKNLRVLHIGPDKELYLIEEMSSQWIEAGDLLGLRVSQIRAIQENNPRNVVDCCQEVMAEWLDGDKRYNYPASWEGLCQLLKNLKLPAAAQLIQDTVLK